MIALASTVTALLLASTAAVAKPTPVFPNAKMCEILPSGEGQKYGRIHWTGEPEGMSFHDPYNFEQGWSAIFNTAVENGVQVERDMAGLFISPSASLNVGANNPPIKVKIDYRSEGENHSIFVKTLQGQSCLVDGSKRWFKITKIEEDTTESDKKIPICGETTFNRNDIFDGTFKIDDEDSSILESSIGRKEDNSANRRPDTLYPSLELQLVAGQGAYVRQKELFDIDYRVSFVFQKSNGQSSTSNIVVNKVGDTGRLCKIKGSEGIAKYVSSKINAVKGQE